MRLEKLKLMCRGLAVLSLASSSLAQAQLPELEDIPNAPVVWLPSGAVRGSGSDVLSFKAIPYAQAPVGNLRWRPPVDAKPWGGILDGASFGPACIQAGDIRKSEDCLFVNVWAPKDAIATRATGEVHLASPDLLVEIIVTAAKI
jgi:para-nitrobenzyl esterase